jgi:UDP-glucose:(heptosyl)LPS alpha-1,3-glucosyltransferase
MGLLMVTDWWDEAGGGRERYLADLRASFVRRGGTITVLTRNELGERRLRHGIDRFRRSHPASAVLSAGPTLGATHYQLHSGVHAAAFAAEGESYDSALRRLCAAPALRLNVRRQRLLRTEERMFNAGSDTKLMVFSARSRDELQRLFGIASDRVALARPGVDLDIFRPPSATASNNERLSRPGGVRLLFAGHNFVLKGLRWALEAQAHARRQGIDARMVVAGRGSIAPFAAMARRLNIAAQVHFAGAVSRSALAQLYRDSDLLIHPTFYDPFPRVIVEALASGVPVVTTAVCGGSELITPGQNGFVVSDPRQIDALTGAIAAVAAPGQRAAMGAAAAATGRCFDFESHADAVATWLAAR